MFGPPLTRPPACNGYIGPAFNVGFITGWMRRRAVSGSRSKAAVPRRKRSAFSADVCPDKLMPGWLAGSQRAPAAEAPFQEGIAHCS